MKGDPKRLREMHRAIEHARGFLKRKPGDKPFAEEMAEYKREEIELEEAKYRRCTEASARQRRK